MKIEGLLYDALDSGTFDAWLEAIHSCSDAWMVAYDYLQQHLDICLTDRPTQAEAAVDALEGMFDGYATEYNLYEDNDNE